MSTLTSNTLVLCRSRVPQGTYHARDLFSVFLVLPFSLGPIESVRFPTALSDGEVESQNRPRSQRSSYERTQQLQLPSTRQPRVLSVLHMSINPCKSPRSGRLPSTDNDTIYTPSSKVKSELVADVHVPNVIASPFSGHPLNHTSGANRPACQTFCLLCRLACHPVTYLPTRYRCQLPGGVH